MLKKIIISLLLFSGFYSLVFSYTTAQGPSEPVSGFFDQKYAPPLTRLGEVGGMGGGGILEKTVNALIAAFWIVTVGFLIWAAFTFLTASGEEAKITEARKRIQYAVIAGIVATLAIGIRPIVFNLLSGGDEYSGGGFGTQCINYSTKEQCGNDSNCEWTTGVGFFGCTARECDDFSNASECNNRSQCEWVSNQCATVSAKCATNSSQTTCDIQVYGFPPNGQCHWDEGTCVAD